LNNAAEEANQSSVGQVDHEKTEDRIVSYAINLDDQKEVETPKQNASEDEIRIEGDSQSLDV